MTRLILRSFTARCRPAAIRHSAAFQPYSKRWACVCRCNSIGRQHVDCTPFGIDLPRIRINSCVRVANLQFAFHPSTRLTAPDRGRRETTVGSPQAWRRIGQQAPLRQTVPRELRFQVINRARQHGLDDRSIRRLIFYHSRDGKFFDKCL